MFDIDWIARLQEVVAGYAPRAVGAALILVLGFFAARLLSKLVARVTRRTGLDATLGAFLGNLTYFAALAFVFLAALDRLGVNTTSFAAVVAAAGLAIGLALQDSLGNFAAGFMLIMLRPFSSGDFVEVAGIAGVVESISIFSTSLRTPDNKAIIVPNGSIVSDNIINYSRKDTRRIDLVFGIGYDDNLLEARQIFERIVSENPRVLDEPATVIAVDELADSSVNFVVRPWVATADYFAVRWELIEATKVALDAAGISIPYPQQDVHLHGSAVAAPAASAEA
ncbi:MAG: mechanosensitive ion channel domain-containing protein [Acidobacteriota bacterium]